MAIAVSIEGVSKQYRLGQFGTGTLAHDLNRWWARFRGNEDPYSLVGQRNDRTEAVKSPERVEYVWALKDINLKIEQGEILGVIGRNGAGKSTLLKLLSRVTAPTSGVIKVRGRMASLLEVGTGFHPELTGSENIYLNGAILGMSRAEIRKRFDDIVGFSGCAKYIDTPVKRYSSGMYVRLAFAVAAHLDSEILIIDEVLAVGDMEFQNKCLGKIGEVTRSGRTVLFVSHSMAAIRALTSRSVFLEGGAVNFAGETSLCIEAYLEKCAQYAVGETKSLDYFRREKSDGGLLRFLGVKVDVPEVTELRLPRLESGEPITVVLEILATEDIPSAIVSVILSKGGGFTVATLLSLDQGQAFSFKKGRNYVSCRIEGIHLTPGQYSITTGVTLALSAKSSDVLMDVPIFEIGMSDLDNGTLVWPERPWGAVHLPTAKWLQS